MAHPAPRRANLIYDVGLHRGEDTGYYLLKGFDVVAFEANPDNAAFCRQKFAADLAAGRLTIVEGAIAPPGTEKVKFYRNADHSFWGSSDESFAQRNEVAGTRSEIIEVAAVDFAACLARYGVPYYLKADIVGSEIICLRALADFENKPAYLSIRSEKVAFHKLETEFDLLESLGYQQFKAVQQAVENLSAPLRSQEGKQVAHVFPEGSSGLFGKDLPGHWKNREEVVAEYRRIFVLYWLFGDYSYLMQTARGRKFAKKLERVVRRPLPGWYDTHARHSTIADCGLRIGD